MFWKFIGNLVVVEMVWLKKESEIWKTKENLSRYACCSAVTTLCWFLCGVPEACSLLSAVFFAVLLILCNHSSEILLLMQRFRDNLRNNQILSCRRYNRTRSSAIMDCPLDALRQSKSYQLLHNCRNKMYNKSTTTRNSGVRALRSTDR